MIMEKKMVQTNKIVVTVVLLILLICLLHLNMYQPSNEIVVEDILIDENSDENAIYPEEVIESETIEMDNSNETMSEESDVKEDSIIPIQEPVYELTVDIQTIVILAAISVMVFIGLSSFVYHSRKDEI